MMMMRTTLILSTPKCNHHMATLLIGRTVNNIAPNNNFPRTFPCCNSLSKPIIRRPLKRPPRLLVFLGARCSPSSNPESSDNDDDDDDDDEALVQDLRVPDPWLLPSKALQESNWLRVTLHKWLDDEYCPEETNVEISKVAAQSYYESLLEKRTDLGEILLKMARELESISYQNSFHGAFSSANAAVNLISQRIEFEGLSMRCSTRLWGRNCNPCCDNVDCLEESDVCNAIDACGLHTKPREQFVRWTRDVLKVSGYDGTWCPCCKTRNIVLRILLCKGK